MRVAILSGNARPADAIGNQIAEKTAFFLERGADVRVLIEDARTVHPALTRYCRAVQTDCLSADNHEFLAASDLVIAEFGHDHTLLMLLPLCNRLGRRVLVDYHGITPLELWGEENLEPIATALRRRGIVWYADAVLVHSSFTEDEIHAHTGFPRQRTFVVGHPIDVDRFGRHGGHGPWRRRLGLAKDERLLLFVGRIARNKRIDILIESLAHLPRQVVLAIAGDDRDIYALEAARCRKLAESADLSGRIRWLGTVAEAELPALYRAADVFVTASEHEGFCIPVVESLCSGTPVVASRAGALPGTLGQGGLLFAPGDAALCAAQLRRLLFNEPDLIGILRERGLSQASRFARPLWRDKFGRLIQQVLDMPPRPIVERVQLEAANEIEIVSTKQRKALVALRVTNGGSHPVELGQIRATRLPLEPGVAESKSPSSRVGVMALNDGSDPIMPGRCATLPVLMGVPERPGLYTVRVRIETKTPAGDMSKSLGDCRIRLKVNANANPLQVALAELAQQCRLPQGYQYHASGTLGRLKAWLSEKLLSGFRRRYVDVPSRQQSAANWLVLRAIVELHGKMERLHGSAKGDEQLSGTLIELLNRVRELERRVAYFEESSTRVMT